MDGSAVIDQDITANTETIGILVEELQQILSIDSIEPEYSLGELGIDSLNIVELLLVCEKIYPSGVNPADLAIDQFTTIRDLDLQMRGEVKH